MFDFDLSKIAVIGTVAMVVLGPERLPRVARTVGTLLGRAQRYLKDVSSEVERQIAIDDLRQLKQDIAQELHGVRDGIQHSVREHAAELQAGLDEAAASVKEGLPVYLPSVHEAGADVQSELFKSRPPSAPAATPAVAQRPLPSSGMYPVDTQGPERRARRGWHGAAAGSRIALAKRGRVVSVAASKSLGRAAAPRRS